MEQLRLGLDGQSGGEGSHLGLAFSHYYHIKCSIFLTSDLVGFVLVEIKLSGQKYVRLGFNCCFIIFLVVVCWLKQNLSHKISLNCC